MFGFAFPNDDTCHGVEDVRGWAVSSAGVPGGEGEEQTWRGCGDGEGVAVADRRGRDGATAGPPGPLVHIGKSPSFRWRSPHARGIAWPAEHRLDSSTQPPSWPGACVQWTTCTTPEEGSTGYGGGEGRAILKPAGRFPTWSSNLADNGGNSRREAFPVASLSLAN